MTISRNGIFTLILVIYFFLVFFNRWLFNNDIIIYVSLMIIPISIIFSKRPLNKKIIFSLFIYFFYILINYLLTFRHNYFFNEIFYYTIPNISISYFLYQFYINCNNKKNFFKKLFWFCNIYFIINLLIMLKQLNNSYFLMFHFNGNNLYFDHITGMIGVNGTHRLAIFYILCLYVNFMFFNDDNKKISIISKIMFILVLISSIILSTLNDNRAYYYLLLIFLIPLFVYFFRNYKENIKRFFKYSIIIILFIFTFLLLYSYNDNFNKFIDKEIVQNIFEKTSNRISATNSSEPSEERVRLFNYAIEKGDGLRLGKGIGSIRILSDPNMPEHFGISEITSRVYTGGLVYIFVIFFVYYNVFIYETSKLKYKVFIIASLLFLTMYLQIFTICEEIFLISLVYMALYYIYINYEL